MSGHGKKAARAKSKEKNQEHKHDPTKPNIVTLETPMVFTSEEKKPSVSQFVYVANVYTLQAQARSVLEAYGSRPKALAPLGGISVVSRHGTVHDKEALKQISMAILQMSTLDEKKKADIVPVSRKRSALQLGEAGINDGSRYFVTQLAAMPSGWVQSLKKSRRPSEA
eukprot:CAMPEP_0203913252 /NCGR_PEP_ID=MMETSP0359-20131031/54275_1 /ASSEMBLY_ACC=CAM_ASM_000338 /TAXON_ID=268821 /ORGANISM="Scrippsiella Hangoei, Strain SHTV-5" /LENGTH=167 /DNA_ID=CAMNT_0050839357 /DNA_START=11 /DNA_END=510 /DNA_ORIENTATION=-